MGLLNFVRLPAPIVLSGFEKGTSEDRSGADSVKIS